MIVVGTDDQTQLAPSRLQVFECSEDQRLLLFKVQKIHFRKYKEQSRLFQ